MKTTVYNEQLLLGMVLANGDLFEKLILQDKHFYASEHRLIYKTMTDLYHDNVFIDVGTLVPRLGDNLEQAGGIGHLTDLYKQVSSDAGFKFYQDNVFRDYRDRESHRLITKFNKDRSDKKRAKLTLDLDELSRVGIVDEKKSTFDNLTEIASEIAEGETGSSRGYQTGFVEFDRMTGGLQRQNLIVLAGRPSMGKSTLGFNLGMEHCKRGGKTHIFTFEMSTKDVLKKMISAINNVSGDVWMNNKFSEEEYRQAIDSITTLSEWNVEFYEEMLSVREINAIMKEAIEKEPDIEHFMLIDSLDYVIIEKETGNQAQDLEVVMRDLKGVAKTNDVPLALIVQLNRGVDQRENKRPFMSDLRSSGAIEQVADVIALIYREDYYERDEAPTNIVEVNLVKQRVGGNGTIELRFVGEHSKFLNLTKNYEGDVNDEPRNH